MIGLNLFNTQNKQESPSFTKINGVKTELNKGAVIEMNKGTDINDTKSAITVNMIKKEALLPNITTNTIAQNENANSNLNSLNNKNGFDDDVAMELVPKVAIDTKTMNETASLRKEIRPISISNVNEEAKNNFEAITPTQVQYSNIDTDEEERVINIANLEIDGAKFRELSRKITTLFKRNKPENDKYK